MKGPVVFFKDEDISWEKAKSLEDWIISMVEKNRTKEPAFEHALNFFGREKFEEIWKAYAAKKKQGAQS